MPAQCLKAGPEGIRLVKAPNFPMQTIYGKQYTPMIGEFCFKKLLRPKESFSHVSLFVRASLVAPNCVPTTSGYNDLFPGERFLPMIHPIFSIPKYNISNLVRVQLL